VKIVNVKKVILVAVLLLLSIILCAENGMEMKESDWLHLTLPGTGYIVGDQLLISCGVDTLTAKFITLSLGVGCIFAHEYFQINDGIATKEDIELGLMSLATGWVFSECINYVFRGSPSGKHNKGKK